MPTGEELDQPVDGDNSPGDADQPVYRAQVVGVLSALLSLDTDDVELVRRAGRARHRPTGRYGPSADLGVETT